MAEKSWEMMKRSFRHRLFFVMWVFWLVCIIFGSAFWLSSVPRFLHRAATGTLPTTVINGLSPALAAAEGASTWGVNVATWSWINVAVNGLSFLVFSFVAVLIWWRVRTGFGLLTAYVLMLGGSAFMNVAVYSAEPPSTAVAVWELGASTTPKPRWRPLPPPFVTRPTWTG